MALLSELGSYPKRTTRVTVRLGEESDLIVIVADASEPDLNGFMAIIFDDQSIATSEVLSRGPPVIKVPDERKRAFVVTGRKVGMTSARISLATRKNFVNLGEIEVVVGRHNDKDVDLFYVGKYLVWQQSLPPDVGTDPLIFAASSGRVIQIAAAQNNSNEGPVPTGKYRILAQFDPQQTTYDQANALLKNGEDSVTGPYKNFRQGIQRLPVTPDGSPHSPAWGENRVRMEPLFKVPADRGGFYLHDSHKGSTSGCIEVRRIASNGSRMLFFDALAKYASGGGAAKKAYLILKVVYRSDVTRTDGDTLE